MPKPAALAATASEDLCRFLSACFYEPTPLFTEERLFESMLQAARQLDAGLAAQVQRLGQAFEADELQTLLVDYTRLFLGPADARARPYGSVWLGGDGLLMQDSTMAVLDLYAEAGFDLDDGFRDVPDHIAVELEFLYVLTFRERLAREAGDAALADVVSGLRRRLLGEHLGRWAGPFTTALRAGADTPFYRALADVVDTWVTRCHAQATAA